MSFILLRQMRKFIKDIVLSILINAGILYWLSFYNFGILIETQGSVIKSYLILGFLFWIVNFWLKKILHIVSFPLKLLTFGFFSIVINVGVIYFFANLINTYYGEIATITLPSEWIKVLFLSIIISFAYALLSKILK